MADNHLFFTELLSMPVLDLKGRRIGRVKDAALVPREHAARIDRFLVGGAETWLTLRFDQIRAIDLDRGIQLSDEQLLPYHDDEYMMRIGRDLLDQQIIDVTGRKVVRVTDVTMSLQHDGQRDILTVLEVDIGLRSMFRRLFQGVLPKRMIRRMQSRIPPNSIRWEFANVVEPDPLRRLRLNISYDKLEDMHPADLSPTLWRIWPPRNARPSSIPSTAKPPPTPCPKWKIPRCRPAFWKLWSPKRLPISWKKCRPMRPPIFSRSWRMRPPKKSSTKWIPSLKSRCRSCLNSRTIRPAGSMNTEYVVLHDSATVSDAMAALKGNEELLETLNTLYLIDEEEHLTAAIPLGRLFLATGDSRLKELAAETLLQVTVDEKQDRVSEYFDKYNLLTLPVVDDEGKLAGVITADDIISILRQK